MIQLKLTFPRSFSKKEAVSYAGGFLLFLNNLPYAIVVTRTATEPPSLYVMPATMTTLSPSLT